MKRSFGLFSVFTYSFWSILPDPRGCSTQSNLRVLYLIESQKIWKAGNLDSQFKKIKIPDFMAKNSYEDTLTLYFLTQITH